MTFNPGQTKQAQELAYSRKTNKNVPPPLWFNNAAVKKHITAWKKCPNTELFLVRVNLRKQPEYRKIRTRNNSAFGHFSRSVCETFRMKWYFMPLEQKNMEFLIQIYLISIFLIVFLQLNSDKSQSRSYLWPEIWISLPNPYFNRLHSL